MSRVADVELAEAVGTPGRCKPTHRSAPPASEGLSAGASKSVHADVRRRRRHPAPLGPLTVETTERLVAAAVAQMDTHTPQEIAVQVGVGSDGRVVRTVIKAARETLARNAERYVEAHMQVVDDALALGDSKALSVAAKASQWAMERIAEDGDRIVDAPKAGPSAPAGLQIGIAIGGVPQPNTPFTVSDIPPLAALPPLEDMP